MAKIKGASNKRHQEEITLAVSKDTPVHESDHGQEFMVVLDKFEVAVEFFDSVEDQFEEIYPALLQDVHYTEVDLCGSEFWTGLSAFGRRMATNCLKHLADLDDVPLLDVSCQGCGTTSFEIIH